MKELTREDKMALYHNAIANPAPVPSWLNVKICNYRSGNALVDTVLTKVITAAVKDYADWPYYWVEESDLVFLLCDSLAKQFPRVTNESFFANQHALDALIQCVCHRLDGMLYSEPVEAINTAEYVEGQVALFDEAWIRSLMDISQSACAMYFTEWAKGRYPGIMDLRLIPCNEVTIALVMEYIYDRVEALKPLPEPRFHKASASRRNIGVTVATGGFLLAMK